MLEVKNVDVFYGDVQVLWDVSFNVQKGEIVALIGANGSGKTTSLNTVSSILKPRKGSVTYEGQPLHTRAPHDLVALGIAHVPEARRLFPEMTVKENLLLGALAPDAKKARPEMLEKVYGIFPRLKEREKQAAGTMSGGEQQMCAIARGLMSKPRLLMLDEPSLGLSPILVTDIFRVIAEVHDAGVTVLLIEQNVFKTLAIADRAYVLESGRIVLTGTGMTSSTTSTSRRRTSASETQVAVRALASGSPPPLQHALRSLVVRRQGDGTEKKKIFFERVRAADRAADAIRDERRLDVMQHLAARLVESPSSRVSAIRGAGRRKLGRRRGEFS